MDDRELPLAAQALLREIHECAASTRTEAIVLDRRDSIKLWIRAWRDLGGHWNVIKNARAHSYSVGLALFDRGIVRIDGTRLVPIAQST